jgi:hypothetical protein
MKMISRTSITSTKGVTLISLIAAAVPRRRRRRPPPPDFFMTPAPMAQAVQLARQDGREFVGKAS